MNIGQDRILAALDRLPQLPRIVYLLSTMDGMRHTEIGFRLGVTVEEVEGHLAEALYLLSRSIREERPPP